MVDTLTAGSTGELYYEYYPYQDLHLCPISQEYGPMTVPMVSTNSSPPIAMPVQVPHGHVVQQIVDESGTLRHVILSPQHPPLLPLPQHFGGGNPSGSSQPASYYPGAMAHGFPAFSPLQPGGVLGHVPPQGHSPPPHNYHKDERTQRQYNKLKKKLEQKQHREHQLNTTPPLSPRKEMNGTSRKGVGSVGTSEDGEESSSLQDDEEENSVITDLLGTIKAPEVSDVTSRTALVQWSPPQIDNPRDVSYDVLLSDRGKEGKYKSIYSGEALSCRIEDLKPGTEYSVRVSARLESIVGCPSEPTLLVTPPCKPDPPPTPKLSSRSRNAITLKWLAAQDNGGHIDHYVVEWEQNGVWTEISKYKSKQAHIPKLQPATQYSFRIAAVNQFGKSDYSGVGTFITCDSPPPQPLPPSLTAATPQSLTLAWAVRQQDDEFMLQMEDVENKHGFLPVYSGKENSYVCQNLRKNTTYKFRLKSQNDDGCSRWSDEVSYSTKAGRPGPPSRPQLKGKLHLHFFRLKWDPPVDTGGAPITNYTVQIHKYNKDTEYQVVYNGPNLTCTIEKLEPGTAYQVRVCCEGPGGTSDFSEPALLATEPVCPGACSSPRLHGRVRSHSIPIKWSYPENDGGSPITEMEVGVRTAEETELRTAYKGKETECVVNELRPAQLYTIVVRAANKVGAGRWSEPLEVMSGCAAPGTPPPPTLGLGAGSVTCSWTPPPAHGSPITSYTLQMSTPPGDNYTQVYIGPATHCEVKPVPPATLCLFRLQATNSIGLSDWSEVRTIVTSAGPPGAVPGLKAESVTPTSISLAWGSPQPNGDLVTHYTVEAGDFSTTVTEQTCLLNALTPATTYRIRVRGVNSIGSGAVSTLKVSTLPLPPEPPQLTCATAGHNFLKLRWGQPNSNVNNHVYTVSMSTHSNRRMVVYEGTSTSCKVSRLQEQTSYNFNITASNSTGKGPESETYTFSTVIAPPPLVKGLKVTEVSNRGCHVEWTALRPQGNDQVDYTIQCARLREQTYKQVYHGSETKCEITELEAGADYLVRACAVRLSPKGPIEGQYCPPVNFSTPPVHHEPPQHPVVRQHTHQGNGRRPLTDQQWAGIILSGFIVLAVLFAMLIAHIIY